MTSTTSKSFPVVSLTHLSKYLDGSTPIESFSDDPKVKLLCQELVYAFTEWGFAYLIDYGIPQSIIDSSYEVSKEFFLQNRSIKEKFGRHNDGENWGWVPFNVETFNKERPYDLKECFNFLPTSTSAEKIKEYVPNFMNSQTKLFELCKDLSQLMMKLLNLALPTDDPDFLINNHKEMGCGNKNASICRFLYYPGIEDESNVLENQLRCGEHSDYGTFTFLFQDNAGGLQVMNPQGQYIDATPIPGSIVMNVADMLEMWSSGRFKSTKHRVVVPKTSLNIPRQSLTLFVHPDNDITVSCLDGSDKYPSVNPFQYLMKKFELTYA